MRELLGAASLPAWEAAALRGARLNELPLLPEATPKPRSPALVKLALGTGRLAALVAAEAPLAAALAMASFQSELSLTAGGVGGVTEVAWTTEKLVVTVQGKGVQALAGARGWVYREAQVR